jgi:hypothetical protein
MRTMQNRCVNAANRRGSTLIIVIALLGLLAFTGMIFFSFSSQERAAAEYFNEAAKDEVDSPDNVFDHPLRHIIAGPSNRPSEIRSIVWSPERRHSIASGIIGKDMAPFSGDGIHLIYEDDSNTLPTTAVPRVDMDWDGTAEDEDGLPVGELNTQTLLDFVDSPAARRGSQLRLERVPAPDVDYTYPDINNLFLAYKGWAIRDNDPSNTGTITPRYERVPIIVPSFFRPAYMKTEGLNGPLGSTDPVPTNLNWASAFDGVDRDTAIFGGRSFRPHPSHIVGFQADGVTRVFRYLTDAEASGLGVASGGFPFLPEDNAAGQPGGLNGVRGELGVWTGSEPDAYELDADNDGDGIREGIWIDTHFPVQEYVDGTGNVKTYVVLHSFTIYDLDGLIDLNIHGNMAALDRSSNVQTIAGSGLLTNQMLSRSNLGLGPNEINPLWALRSNLAAAVTVDVARQFQHHFGKLPVNGLEQANMEWLWILSGRAQIDTNSKLEDLFTGRWGENERLFNAFKPGGTFLVADLPRPGRAGNAQEMLSSGFRYGGTLTTDGRNGFDDNVDALDGEISARLGRIRPFGTPLDYAGTGRTHQGAIGNYNAASGTFDVTSASRDIRLDLRHHDTASTGAERFQLFNGYSVSRGMDTTLPRYLKGQNGTFDNLTNASDDLVQNASLDPLLEDPLESIFDPELAQRDFDRVFGPEDIFALHLTASDLANSPDEISERLKELSPYALDDGNAPFSFNETTTPGIRSRFTTISNSLRRFMTRSPFGADGKPGLAGADDDGDSTIDEPDEVLATNYKDTDSQSRYWEYSADTDGSGTNGSGYPNGDGFLEFPPAFGTSAVMGLPYSSTDPFRAQARRLLTIESGDSRSTIGQLPLSINHLLDVERTPQTPDEGTPAFLRYMQRAGMRFRPLTDHPISTEGNTVLNATTLPTWSTATPVAFPPVIPEEREFWARRDRQKLARDIYVLLYTTGGAGIDGTAATPAVRNYTAANDPGADVGGSLYTHEQLRRMAQFAVNLVDAMDSDNVVTKFEYDKNLGPDAGGTFGGWNMDDNAYSANVIDVTKGLSEDAPSNAPLITSNGLYPEDSLERGVVYGVEAQELTFSETLAARMPKINLDGPQSLHVDSDEEINLLHVELQNMRPTQVEMSTTVTGTTNEQYGIWQLSRINRTSLTAIEPATATQTLTLMQGNAAVPGGDRYTVAIASKKDDPGFADPTGWQTADLYVDYDSDMDFELVSPDLSSVSVTSGPVTPQCNLDVVSLTHAGRWLTQGSVATEPGAFLNNLVEYGGNSKFRFAAAGASKQGFDLVLRRRLNPNMPRLPLTENPWIEVDRTFVVFEEIFKEEMDPMTMMPAMVVHLNDAPSVERGEAMDATDIAFTPPLVLPSKGTYNSGTDIDPQLWRFNTIGSTINSRSDSTNGFDLLQRHYDREYSSAAELLQLPVIGPNLLTHRINRMRYSPYQQVFTNPNDIPADPIPASTNISSAETMFLQPDFPNRSAATWRGLYPTVSAAIPIDEQFATSVNSGFDNRWYRLLQFVEVPSRVHRMLGNYLTLQKLPGKLNINMIRHREVFAGLIDNPYLADVPNLADLTPAYSGGGTDPGNGYQDSPFMTSVAGVGGRDLWHQMMNDRDGRPLPSWNPTTSTTLSYWLPGTPNAHPFRSPGFRSGQTADENGINETILRRMRNDIDDDNNGIADDDPSGFNTDGTAKPVGASDTASTNRHWLELASSALHTDPDNQGAGQSPSPESRHRILSKVVNNTTTVSNTFVVYATAAYFEAIEDPTSGLMRVGGRLDLEPATAQSNPGWQQRAIFIIDRTEAFEAYDPGSGDFDWNRLIKARATIE